MTEREEKLISLLASFSDADLELAHRHREMERLRKNELKRIEEAISDWEEYKLLIADAVPVTLPELIKKRRPGQDEN